MPQSYLRLTGKVGFVSLKIASQGICTSSILWLQSFQGLGDFRGLEAQVSAGGALVFRTPRQETGFSEVQSNCLKRRYPFPNFDPILDAGKVTPLLKKPVRSRLLENQGNQQIKLQTWVVSGP